MENRNTALEQITHVLEISNTDFTTLDIVGRLLDESVGAKDNVTQYRPNYVIAVQLWLDTTNNLIKGEGATFDQNFEVTRRYLNIQKIQDTGMSIPEQYQCDTLLKKINGEDTNLPKEPITLGFMSF